MKDMQVLPYDFYNRDTLEVAPDLLGKYLIRKINGHQLVGKIVEVEAYKGSIDKGAHSYNYRRTPRTEVMFGPPGHAYVYLIYGMYYCLNIVTEEEGRSMCVAGKNT
jgi:DNA-3-methyladenine glycosylase